MNAVIGNTYRLFSLVLGGTLLTLSLIGCNAVKTSQYETETQPIVMEFLKLLDEGSYAKAFAAPGVKLSRDSSKFVDWVTERRPPMGAFVSRSLWGSKRLTSIPGKPDGEYLDMRFRSEFEHKVNAWEGVILTKANGEWTVINYYLY